MRPRCLRLLALASAMLFPQCDRSPSIPPEQRVTQLVISPSELTLLAIGARAHPQLTARDAGGRSVSGVVPTWTTADAGVARVDSGRVVVAVGVGTTVLTATIGTASAQLPVLVTQVPASVRIAWPGDTILRAFGAAGPASAVVYDSGGTAIPGAGVSWSVSDTMVAVVDATGRLTLRRNGPVVLRATAGGETATLRLLGDVRGSLRVRISIRGPGRPAGGYTLAIDGTTYGVTGDTTLVVGDLREGVHPVSVTGTSRYCLALSQDRQGASVLPADTIELPFAFRCTGRFSYVSWSDHALHYMDEYGRESVLTPAYAGLASYEWSADGARVVYAASLAAGGPTHIFTAHADGTGVIQLTNGATGEGQPHWSPDGSLILFAAPGQIASGCTWYLMRADGSDVRQLLRTTGFAYDASWAPDGRRIQMLMRDNTYFGLVLVDPTTGRISPLSVTSDALAGGTWSPDGTRIAYLTGLTNAGAVNVLTLAANRVVRTSFSASAVGAGWSPDGRQLLVTLVGTTATTSRYWIATVSADGGGVTRLTSDDADAASPSYSRDGQSILYLTYPGLQPTIRVMDSDAGQPLSLPFAGDYPSGLGWRP